MKEDPVLKIIKNSGNGFHLKVADFLKSLGWDVCISQFYSDPITGKSREIDILATKKFPISDSGEYFCVRLFVECKYVNKENVLWFIDKDEEKTKALIQENQIMKGCTNNNFFGVRPHHYVEGNKVAKLSANSGKTDIFFDGMNSCLHSLISLKNQNYESNRIDYPLIILSSFKKVHQVTPGKDKEYSEIEDNFQLAIDYSYPDDKRNINKYFLIDIISYDLLEDFLEKLEETDIRIAEGLLLSEIKEQGFQKLIQNRNDNDYDPYD